ncbi:MAG: dephospho-CoA kinase, partial [Candidatus Omnitrophica bacterium]|nr:dephospho-CoA kinase [Candidatus Omnitrophota bacterium]
FKKDARCRRQVRAAFGAEVLTKEGVDRGKLGRIVFGNRKALEKLEGIVHPLVKGRIEEILRTSRARITVLDVPLLIEAGWAKMVNVLIVVKAGRKIQLERLQKRTGLSRGEIMKRLKRQMPEKEKVKYADMVIDNRRSFADTDKQVQKIWDLLTK